jgi:AraC-like DNA-binding protein
LRAWLSPDSARIDVSVHDKEPGTAVASINPIQLGPISGCLHRSNFGHTVEAAPATERYTGADFYYLRDGNFSVETSTGITELAPGDMAIFFSGHETRTTSNTMNLMAFAIPPSLLQHRLSPDLFLTVPAKGHLLGTCLQAMLDVLADYQRALQPNDSIVLQAVLADMVNHIAAGERPARRENGESGSEKLHTLQNTLLTQLDDSNLTPRGLAEHAGISVRTLHRLFHQSGSTFSGWLRDQRLERCWHDLAHGKTGDRTVAEIAFRWGFNDLTTFNRNFRAKYGVPPKSVLTSELPETAFPRFRK